MKLTVTQMIGPAIQVLAPKLVALGYRMLRRWPGELMKAFWIRRTEALTPSRPRVPQPKPVGPAGGVGDAVELGGGAGAGAGR